MKKLELQSKASAKPPPDLRLSPSALTMEVDHRLRRPFPFRDVSVGQAWTTKLRRHKHLTFQPVAMTTQPSRFPTKESSKERYSRRIQHENIGAAKETECSSRSKTTLIKFAWSTLFQQARKFIDQKQRAASH